MISVLLVVPSQMTDSMITLTATPIHCPTTELTWLPINPSRTELELLVVW